MPNPVSVIIPAYNVAPYIAEALESLFAQTHQDFEAIVINDGSTDETEEKLAPYRDRIVYIKQENSGVMSARNAGLRVARGRYIALLDGDDLWAPRFLERLLEMLESDESLSAAYPNAIFLGSPKFSGRLYQEIFPATEPVTFDGVLRRKCHIFGSLVIRRDALDDAGWFDETLEGQGAEDFELWLRMLQRGHRFRFTSESLAKYRWRHDSLSNTGIGSLSCLISVYEKFLANELTAEDNRDWIKSRLPELRAQLNYAQFKDATARNDFKQAARYLANANRYYRRPKLMVAQIIMKLAPRLVAKIATP
ncbi:MAG TPA: glycosyltransferase family A protein [Blastocatellia bacterium]|nr:glycosyltransferase family A protein [Blastocatellia bacterium]